ncbi:hypothetical protein PR048_000979 [Dryococelus australis]|uniref:Uncharacterized protein n=1 Tax=Dryococelus australis TaxID=614101 RepID=A0ABQ9III3_9NEOP|nr:hypothetical protein PR048_000979 [Dryococelus australis]
MTFGGLLVRKTRATVLLLGQTSPMPPLPPPPGACYLGSVMLFRSPVFTRERAMYLVGLGPNHINLTECDVDRRSPNFTTLFGPKTLKANIDWEMILDGKSGNLKELQVTDFLFYVTPCLIALMLWCGGKNVKCCCTEVCGNIVVSVSMKSETMHHSLFYNFL